MSGTKAVQHHPGIYRYEVRKGPPNRRTRYAAVATYLGRQRWTRGHLTIKAAEESREALRAEMRGATKASARLTLVAFMEHTWLPGLDVTPGTQRIYKGAIKRIAEAMPGKLLARVTVADVDAFKLSLRYKGYAGHTQHSTFVTLSQALRDARRRRLIHENPCDFTEAPKKCKRRQPVFDAEAVLRLLNAADAEGYETLIWLALDGGLREEKECFAAKWADLDVQRAVLRVPDSKTPAGERAVQLGPASMKRLYAHRIVQLQWFQERGAVPPGLIFVDRQGRPMTQSNFWETWRRIRDAAGLSELHFHDLRHVHTTVLARMGIHPKVAQARLGHADSKITMDVYTHEVPEGQAEAATALERWLGR